jgi:hypothetical protein
MSRNLLVPVWNGSRTQGGGGVPPPYHDQTQGGGEGRSDLLGPCGPERVKCGGAREEDRHRRSCNVRPREEEGPTASGVGQGHTTGPRKKSAAISGRR